MPNSDRYTPSTDQVREIVARSLIKPAPGAVNDVAYVTTKEGRAAFDRWLAAHDAEVRVQTVRAAAFDALQYIGTVIWDRKYGHDLEWVIGNVRGVGRIILQKAGLMSGPQTSIPVWNADNPHRPSEKRDTDDQHE